MLTVIHVTRALLMVFGGAMLVYGAVLVGQVVMRNIMAELEWQRRMSRRNRSHLS